MTSKLPKPEAKFHFNDNLAMLNDKERTVADFWKWAYSALQRKHVFIELIPRSYLGIFKDDLLFVTLDSDLLYESIVLHLHGLVF
jgi:hypothetical protein